MLELRPCCEHCKKALPPDSTGAEICSFECTFCRDCARARLPTSAPIAAEGFGSDPCGQNMIGIN